MKEDRIGPLLWNFYGKREKSILHGAYAARYLLALALPFVVRDPPELRQALLNLAKEANRIAAAA